MEIVNRNTRSSYEVDILYDLVYSYYPKSISFRNEKELYASSPQFKLFQKRLNAQSHYFKSIENLLFSTSKELNSEMIFRNSSRFSWFDRAYNFQYIKRANNFIQCICVNISVLIPYYTVYVVEVKLKTNSSEWTDKPTRNIKLEKFDYNQEVSLIGSKIEQELKLRAFPSKAFDLIIPDISFQDIEAGNFTLFNAYFLDEFLIN